MEGGPYFVHEIEGSMDQRKDEEPMLYIEGNLDGAKITRICNC